MFSLGLSQTFQIKFHEFLTTDMHIHSAILHFFPSYL